MKQHCDRLGETAIRQVKISMSEKTPGQAGSSHQQKLLLATSPLQPFGCGICLYLEDFTFVHSSTSGWASISRGGGVHVVI